MNQNKQSETSRLRIEVGAHGFNIVIAGRSASAADTVQLLFPRFVFSSRVRRPVVKGARWLFGCRMKSEIHVKDLQRTMGRNGRQHGLFNEYSSVDRRELASKRDRPLLLETISEQMTVLKWNSVYDPNT